MSWLEFATAWCMIVLTIVSVYRLVEARRGDRVSEEILWTEFVGPYSLRVVRFETGPRARSIMWDVFEGETVVALGVVPCGTEAEHQVDKAKRAATAVARAYLLGVAANTDGAV